VNVGVSGLVVPQQPRRPSLLREDHPWSWSRHRRSLSRRRRPWRPVACWCRATRARRRAGRKSQL